MTINQQMTAFFVNRYIEDNSRLKYFIEMEVAKLTIIPVYKQFVKEEDIVPVENLTNEEKEILRNDLIKLGCPITQTTAKILHTIKFIDNNTIVDNET